MEQRRIATSNSAYNFNSSTNEKNQLSNIEQTNYNNQKMLIPSIIPSALHLPDQVAKGTKGTEVDDMVSQKSYPAANGNLKMIDATTMQHDET